VARYGRDTFAVLLPDTDSRGAWIRAERTRAAIKELETTVRITASIGSVTFDGTLTQSCKADDLLRKAGQLLYVAKTRGKDRTVSANAEATDPAGVPRADAA